MRTTLLLLVLATPAAFAAFERGGSMTPGPVTATIALPSSAWTAFSSPGAVASVTERTVALSYTPRPFGLPELAQSALAFIEPFSFGAAALTLQRYGFGLYREVTAGIVAGVRSGEIWSAGIGVNGYALSIAGYGSAFCVGIDAGIVVDLSDEFRAGFSAQNLNAPAIGRCRERLPQLLAAGCSYRPMDALTLAADVVKDLRYPVDFIAGLEYAPVPAFRILAGSGTESSGFRAGAIVAFEPVEAGYLFSSHPELGATHRFTLRLTPGRF